MHRTDQDDQHLQAVSSALLTAKLLQNVVEVVVPGRHVGVVGADGGMADLQGPLMVRRRVQTRRGGAGAHLEPAIAQIARELGLYDSTLGTGCGRTAVPLATRPRPEFSTEAVQTPARVNVTCVTPPGEEVASTW